MNDIVSVIIVMGTCVSVVIIIGAVGILRELEEIKELLRASQEKS